MVLDATDPAAEGHADDDRDPDASSGAVAELRGMTHDLLERGIRDSGNVATVPWGANLDEVRAALTALLSQPRSTDA